jgi:hypothetical protein
MFLNINMILSFFIGAFLGLAALFIMSVFIGSLTDFIMDKLRKIIQRFK